MNNHSATEPFTTSPDRMFYFPFFAFRCPFFSCFGARSCFTTRHFISIKLHRKNFEKSVVCGSGRRQSSIDIASECNYYAYIFMFARWYGRPLFLKIFVAMANLPLWADYAPFNFALCITHNWIDGVASLLTVYSTEDIKQ